MQTKSFPFLLCILLASLVSGHQTGAAQDGNAQAGTPAAQPDSPPQDDASQGVLIEMENWVKPQPGWLYVLDPRSAPGELGGRVWLVDPQAGKVMGSIRTGYHPDFALSPDGTRLYVAAETRLHSSEIAAIDTASGTLLGGSPLTDRVVPKVLPSYSTMAVSADGAALRVLVHSPTSADNVQLRTISTVNGDVSAGRLGVGNCADGHFVSTPALDQVDFACPTTKKVWLLRTDNDSKELDNTYAEFPWNHKIGLAQAFPTRDGKYITIVRGDGAIFEMDVTTLNFYGTAAHGSKDDPVYPGAWPTSPDGRKVYLGYPSSAKAVSANAVANAFHIYDTATWHKLGTIKTSVPIWSAAIGDDGNQLYALAPDQHSILVIDLRTMHEIGAISVGTMPALAIVVP